MKTKPILTFFSGFGLGTILTPVFVIFFPIDLAIALTGVVHFFNNIFKLFLVGRDADKSILIRFGIPAIFSSFLGTSVVIGTLIDFSRLAVYSTRFLESGLIDNLPLVAIAKFSAILGAFLGNKLLKKVTLKFLQQFIAILLILISIALGAGWI
ncbi:Sulfite exporter TauE/SafE [Algoriphagus alkaliphilus]|uniref:Probable membrane transporter protein n=1 Tax=Algoriphagus alkaliphilus TaxID=279824 RepID=A0A1G5ZLG4_9BACT|nr:TSUP family transporter [Algoriphagus alkaliphilus]MBA4301376.1 hypothetical protein [Cyclobacterium sp.]SDA95649.1 Sulfite exporter TauE/SafE [Algoriphagus alkaliphilus]